ncbi:MAG: ATP-dependent DNA ligase [Sphingomonadales bacterium]|nr:ATP-dependent DNA ligase [Sphingomonadales bacterium]
MSGAPVEPMEALLAEQLPEGDGWQYEPKWDGFRCIAVKERERVELWSKSGKPLARYFPEVEALVGGLESERFIIDGELLIERGDTLSFEALQARLHPAASRVQRLSRETPARFMAFDCLGRDGKSFVDAPLRDRRSALADLLEREPRPDLLLSPATLDRHQAAKWLSESGGALDGVIAKRLDDSYRPGERAMIKVKVKRTADCVVGGFRYEQKGGGVASLLLGLYDEQGLLNHVGFTSSIPASSRHAWAIELAPLIGPPGFTGKAPGGPSRWSNERSTEWQPLKAEIVVEVLYDQVTGDRFRHGTRLMRRRPDKAPRQCRMEQLGHALTPAEVAQLMAG